MDVRRFVLLGDSVLAQARERAGTALAAWRAAWGIESEALNVECVRAAAQRHVEPGWRGYRVAEATLAWIRFDDTALESLGKAMFRGAPGTATLASSVILDARDDLLATLLGALRGEPAVGGAPALEIPPASLFLPGAGTLRLRVNAAGAILHLLVPPPGFAAPAGIADGRVREAAPIAGLDAAVGDMPVTLQAQIGSIEIDLGALNGLVEGDVIRLGAKVEQPLAIVGPDGTTVFHGHLGVQDGARALDLVN